MKQVKLGMEHQEQAKKNTEEHESAEDTFMSLTKDFCGYTSAHGFERIMSSKQSIRKAFWSVLFIAAIVVLSFQFMTLLEKFRSRPLVTLVSLQSDTVRIGN